MDHSWDWYAYFYALPGWLLGFTVMLAILTVAGCANKTANVACNGMTDALASPCLAAANVCQGVLKLPCYVVPMPSPTAAP